MARMRFSDLVIYDLVIGKSPDHEITRSPDHQNRRKTPLAILGALVLISLAAMAEAGTRKIPTQFYRGWWYARVAPTVAECQIRISLPYDLPATAHFHVLFLPMALNGDFLGDRASWPKGWVWDKDHPTGTPLSHSSVVAHQTGMSLRVSPSALTSPGVTLTTSWGDLQPVLGVTLQWEWTEVESRLHYHSLQAHAPVRDFRQGSRTPWLDVKAMMAPMVWPVGTAQVLIALAPYHAPTPAGQDQAFTCFPPKGGDARAIRPRSEGDYPNDPVLLWSTHHEDAGPWKQKFSTGASKVFGALNTDMTHMVQFPAAWMDSLYRFTLWSDTGEVHPVDVGMRRLQGGNVKNLARTMKMEEGIHGQSMVTVLPASVVKAYHQSFKVLRSVNPLSEAEEIPPPPPAGPPGPYDIPGLPVLDDPLFETNKDKFGAYANKFSLGIWASTADPALLARVNTWIKRGVDFWNVYVPWGITFNFLDLMFFASLEYLLSIDIAWDKIPPGDLIMDPLIVIIGNAADPDDPTTWLGGYIGLKLNGTIPSSDQDPGSVFLNLVYEIAGVFAGNIAGIGGPPPAAAELRPPLSWDTLLPPIFGQQTALASPELANLAFTWWRTSAARMASPTALNALGLDPALFPWAAWFPTGEDHNTDLWWSKYQEVPWARLLKDPAVPAGISASSWRFSGTTLAWGQQLKNFQHWPPQPPQTPVSNDGEQAAQMVLPTAAYPLGPIEIKFKP